MPLKWILWADLGIQVMLGSAFLATGYLVSRRREWARSVSVLIGGAAIGYRVLTSLWPDLLYVGGPYLVLTGLISPTGFMLLGAGLAIPKKNSRQRVLIGAFSAVLAYYIFCDAAYLAVKGPEIASLAGRWEGEVMRQTRSFTCAPAAGATLLRAWGIVVSEGEMACAARTSFRGTELSRLAEAIRLHGSDKNLEVEILRATLSKLYDLNLPAVLFVRKTGGIHSVTLLKMSDDKMLISDPASGSRELSVEEFGSSYQWTGRVIVARRTGEPAREPDEQPDPTLH